MSSQDYGRDVDIGKVTKSETVREVLVDLKVGESLVNIQSAVEAHQEELERIRRIGEIAIDEEVD